MRPNVRGVTRNRAGGRVGRSHTEAEHDKRVLRVVTRLRGMVPTIEELKDRTNKTDQQNKRGNDLIRTAGHGQSISPAQNKSCGGPSDGRGVSSNDDPSDRFGQKEAAADSGGNSSSDRPGADRRCTYVASVARIPTYRNARLASCRLANAP